VISRGNFYHHFKTKDAILDSVINARMASTRAMPDRWEIDAPIRYHEGRPSLAPGWTVSASDHAAILSVYVYDADGEKFPATS
jgi:AcrR family transcriptional regulator